MSFAPVFSWSRFVPVFYECPLSVIADAPLAEAVDILADGLGKIGGRVRKLDPSLAASVCRVVAVSPLAGVRLVHLSTGAVCNSYKYGAKSDGVTIVPAHGDFPAVVRVSRDNCKRVAWGVCGGDRVVVCGLSGHHRAASAVACRSLVRVLAAVRPDLDSCTWHG